MPVYHCKSAKLEGQKFGRLTVQRRIGSSKCGKALWLCVCECGGTKEVITRKLTSGSVVSCGCVAPAYKHGYSYTCKSSTKDKARTHNTWMRIKDRCNNPNNTRYGDYGGRGITYCERWEDFENFLADMGLTPKGMSIDRIDVNGNYEPSNCRWATPQQQADNKRAYRNTIMITYKGVTKPLPEWAKLCGMPVNAVRKRIYANWSTQDALEKPINKNLARY